MTARVAALRGIANIGLRWLLANNKSFSRADVRIGDTALFSKGTNKKGAPRRGGSTSISDIDETGVTTKSQTQTFDVARFRAREKVAAKDVEGADVDPLRTRLSSVALDLGSRQPQVYVEVGIDVDGEDGKCTSSTGIPESDLGPNQQLFRRQIPCSVWRNRPLRMAPREFAQTWSPPLIRFATRLRLQR